MQPENGLPQGPAPFNSRVTRIFFYNGYILYIGRPGSLSVHAHTQAAVVAGLDGEITVATQDKQKTVCQTALLPGGFVHAIESGKSLFVSLLIEPGTEVPGELAGDLATGEFTVEPTFGRLLTEAAYKLCQAQPEEYEPILTKLLARPVAKLTVEIAKVCEILIRDRDAGVGAVAREISRSVSWLSHNFKKETGVSLSRYRVWFRLKAAALFLGRGYTMVDAALAAGFCDQAHFSNAFREIFGIQPGHIFSGNGPIHVYMPDGESVERLVYNYLA